MEKSLVIKRLEDTMKMVENLKDGEFNFENWVTKGNNKEGYPCGTICCVAGWYPKYFPESGLRWDLPIPHNTMPKLSTKEGNINNNNIIESLSTYHGINISASYFLFAGAHQELTNKEEDIYFCPFIKINNYITLSYNMFRHQIQRKDVIEAIKGLLKVIELYPNSILL